MGLMQEIIKENHGPRRKLLVSIRKGNIQVGGASIAGQIPKDVLQEVASVAGQNDTEPFGGDFSFRQGLDRLSQTD